MGKSRGAAAQSTAVVDGPGGPRIPIEELESLIPKMSADDILLAAIMIERRLVLFVERWADDDYPEVKRTRWEGVRKDLIQAVSDKERWYRERQRR